MVIAVLVVSAVLMLVMNLLVRPILYGNEKDGVGCFLFWSWYMLSMVMVLVDILLVMVCCQ